MKLKHLETATIPKTTGKRLIKDQGGLFAGYIDSDFVNYGLTKQESAKPETIIAVMEQTEDATFKQMLEGLDLDKCVLTQEQFIAICEEHRDVLQTSGYSTFALIKNDDEFFVVRVRFVDDDRLGVSVDEFSDVSVWCAEYARRFVFPQLALSDLAPQTPKPLETLTPSKLEQIELALWRKGWGKAIVEGTLEILKEVL